MSQKRIKKKTTAKDYRTLLDLMRNELEVSNIMVSYLFYKFCGEGELRLSADDIMRYGKKRRYLLSTLSPDKKYISLKLSPPAHDSTTETTEERGTADGDGTGTAEGISGLHPGTVGLGSGDVSGDVGADG